jgi:hypothetical protein
MDTPITRNSYTTKLNGELRHQSVAAILEFFQYDHLSAGLRETSEKCAKLAIEMADTIPEDPELTVGLRKLLEAKDCFVRAYKRGKS